MGRLNTDQPGRQVLPIDPEWVRHLFTYDPETGVLYWRASQSNRVQAGSVAGAFNNPGRPDARWAVKIKGKSYLRSRLVWAYVHGRDPVVLVDHRDRNTLNDRAENLRLATESQNQINRVVNKRLNRHLPRGVHPSPAKDGERYLAKVTVGRKVVQLGTYESVERAAQVVQEALVREHGEEWLPTDAPPCEPSHHRPREYVKRKTVASSGPTVASKACSICKQVKAAGDFWANAFNSTGLRSECAACSAECKKVWTARKKGLAGASA